MNSPQDSEKDSLTLRVLGDLLSTNAEALQSEFARLLEGADVSSRKWGIFRLDLTGAKMVDSVGLNLVVTLLKRVQKRGARMQIAYSNANVLRTFSFTRLDRHVELVKA